MKKAPYLTLIFLRLSPAGSYRYAGGLRCRFTGSPQQHAHRYGINPGVPSFMQVLEVVTAEMQVEAAIPAEEIKTHNPQLHATLLTHLELLQQHRETPLKFVTPVMSSLKQTADSQAVIRSGSVPRMRTLFSVPA